MIELLTDMPEGVLGFRAAGQIAADDYTEVLKPAIDDVLRAWQQQALNQEDKLIVEAIEARGITIHHLDLGGGLGITYTDEVPPAAEVLVKNRRSWL